MKVVWGICVLLVMLVAADATSLRVQLPKALKEKANEDPPSAGDFTPFNPASSFLATDTVEKDTEDYKKCDVFGAANKYSGEIIVTSDEPIKIFTVENKEAVCYRDDVHKIFGKFWRVRLGESCEVPMKGLVRIIMAGKDGKPKDMAANYDCETWKSKVDAKNEDALQNGGQVDHQVQSWFESKTEDGLPFVAKFVYQAIAEQFEVAGEDTETTTSSKKAIYLAEVRVFYENPTEVKAKEEEVQAADATKKAEEAALKAQELKKEAEHLRAQSEETRVEEEIKKKEESEEAKAAERAEEIEKIKNETDNPVPQEGIRTIIPPLVDYSVIPDDSAVTSPSKFTLESTKAALVQINKDVVMKGLEATVERDARAGLFGKIVENPTDKDDPSAGPVAAPDDAPDADADQTE